MILVVSPLKALMMDEVSAIRRLGLSAVCVTIKSVPQILKGCKKENIKSHLSVQKHFSYLQNGKLRWALTNLVGFVIDEAHCIKKWYVLLHYFDYLHVLAVKFVSIV